MGYKSVTNYRYLQDGNKKKNTNEKINSESFEESRYVAGAEN